MPKLVAFLRGVNVGGHRKVGMAELRETLIRTGFQDVQTLLASGNVLFSPREDAVRLMESAVAPIQVVIRSGSELTRIVAANPFPEETERAPGRVVVLFAKGPVDAAAVARLQSVAPGSEVARLAAGHAVVFFPDGMGTSKLSAARIDRALGSMTTGRNWNTVVKLAALAE